MYTLTRKPISERLVCLTTSKKTFALCGLLKRCLVRCLLNDLPSPSCRCTMLGAFCNGTKAAVPTADRLSIFHSFAG